MDDLAELLQRPPAEVAAASQRFAETVLPHFGATLEPVQTDPGEDLAEFDDQRGEQTVTLLRTLGYLDEPPEGATAHVWSAAAIAVAWADWRADWRAMLAGDAGVEMVLAGEAPGAGLEGYAALRALKACATLEGEVRLTRWPEAGRTSLGSRIVLSRLRLYGLAERDPRQPLPASLEAELLARARNLTADRQGIAGHELANRLGDIAGLTRELTRRLDGNFVLLAERAAASGLEETEYLTTAGGRSIRVLAMGNPASRDLNRLTLRVLQVRLWTLGYYEGEIDGLWRDLSESALMGFAAHFELGEHRAFVGTVASGRVVLDAGRILRCFTEQVDAVAEGTERAAIDAALDKARTDGSREAADFWQALEQSRAGERDRAAATPTLRYDAADNVVSQGANVRRRRYFGWRGIFAAFGRFLGRVGDLVHSVLGAIAHGLSSVAGLLRNIARYVVDATRVAIRVAALGLQRLRCWLTETPVVTGEGAAVVATVWQHDFDTVNLVGRGCPASVVARHTQVLDWMQRSLDVMLRIGLRIAQLLLAFGNWLLFAWRALALVREVLKDAADPALRELVAETAPT